MIDRYLEKQKHKDKMTDRFAESNNILIQSLKDNAKNKNTLQSTNNWINVWTNRILVDCACWPRKAKQKQTVSCLSEIYQQLITWFWV